MSKQTPLHDLHAEQGAKMVDFFGWQMPLHYGSQLAEHKVVRESAGLFDVSHMTVVDVLGAGARDFLRYLLANDVDKLKRRGRALYGVMLNNDGGVIDDLIVYFLDVHHYRVILNASTREQDLAWMNQHTNGFSVGLHERDDLAMIAVQGPDARDKVHAVLTPEQLDSVATLTPFDCTEAGDFFIARTGYTGEDGYEIVLPNDQAAAFWKSLLAEGVSPCGLGARDTLRLEAGLNLYGAEMDAGTSPLVANLAWTIAWEPADRLFIGRAALELQKSAGVKRQLVGLVLLEKGVLRAGQTVSLPEGGEGIITSGTFSPTLNCAVALARVPKEIGAQCEVILRGKAVPAKVVKPCFVRNGKKMFD